MQSKTVLISSSVLQRPPSLVRLGPGSTWNRVLRYLPPNRFTMVHPQCTNVGVGGFLLGGGVNYEGPQTAKFGTGAENVVEYQMVDAYGDIVRVNGNQITRRSFHGGEVRFLLILARVFS